MALTDLDRYWMSRAVQLARRGRYTARPNPCVGCVLVKDGVAVGEGWHYRAGEPHAEVNALAAAIEGAAGATAYVTLEPCNHRGKTGPCTQALISAGITRMVYGMQDPNPLVAGSGIAALEAVGVTVEGPLLEAECRQLNPGFISRMERQRPWLRAKLAVSLDGRTAMASGESQWITGGPARADVQRWRARSCAIVTGVGSVLADNSRLTLRREELDLPNCDDVLALPPLRVVLDSQLRLPADAAVVKADAPTLIVTSQASLTKNAEKLQQLLSDNVSVATVSEVPGGGLSLPEVLALLVSDHQCNEVLLEAGATLCGAFLQQRLIDELLIYQAPVLLGSQARSMFTLPLEKMADKVVLDILDRRQLGDDQRIIARVC